MRGFAVSENDEIDVKSISNSPRGAAVNWLVTRTRVLVPGNATAENIRDVFAQVASKTAASLIEVEIVEKFRLHDSEIKDWDHH